MDTQLCSTFKRDDVLDASKSNLPIPCLELLNWFKRIKNNLRIFGDQLAVDESFSKDMILFF